MIKNCEENKVYNIKDIQTILKMSRSKSYSFIKKVFKDKQPFKVIKIGKNYKIIKESFENWLKKSL